MALICAAISACHFGAGLLVLHTYLRHTRHSILAFNMHLPRYRKDAAIAPAVERTLGKGEVACSNHAGSTILCIIFDVTN